MRLKIMVFAWLIVVWNINDIMNSPVATLSKNSKKLLGATPPSFNIHSPAFAPCSPPYRLPIMAVPTVGLWLIVVFLAALGLAAAMLAAKYPK